MNGKAKLILNTIIEFYNSDLEISTFYFKSLLLHHLVEIMFFCVCDGWRISKSSGDFGTCSCCTRSPTEQRAEPRWSTWNLRIFFKLLIWSIWIGSTRQTQIHTGSWKSGVKYQTLRKLLNKVAKSRKNVYPLPPTFLFTLWSLNPLPKKKKKSRIPIFQINWNI